MPSYNRCILIGHLTRDPQSKTLPSQSTVTEFGLAVNHKFKTKDGSDREEVAFIDCAAFGKGGDVIAQYCQKGKALLVEGRLKQDNWEDKQTGAKRSKISLVVDNFQFLGGRDDGGAGQESGSRQPPRRQGGWRSQASAQNDFDAMPNAEDCPF